MGAKLVRHYAKNHDILIGSRDPAKAQQEADVRVHRSEPSKKKKKKKPLDYTKVF
jgi:hypothetical protein